MKTAISIFDARVAPVFDTAREICLVERSASGAPTKTFCRFEDGDLQAKVAWLVATGVQTLICGAVSQPIHHALVDAGIDYELRGMEKPSDHAPIWLELN